MHAMRPTVKNSDNHDNFDRYDDNDSDKVRGVYQENCQKTGYRSATPFDLESTERLNNSFTKHKKRVEAAESSNSCAVRDKCDASSLGKQAVADASVSVPARSSKTEAGVVTEEVAKPIGKTVVAVDDDGWTRQPRFEPERERPLEREMKAVREREWALRRARGLTTDDELVPQSVEVQAATRSVTWLAAWLSGQRRSSHERS